MSDFRKERREEDRPLSEEEINSPDFDPKEFAPAPEAVDLPVTESRNSGGRASMVFAIICAFLALVLAVVGTLCAPTVADRKESARRDAVLRCFENCNGVEFYDTVEGCDVYAVLYGGRLAGYGVYCTSEGFGGDMEILVCFDTDDRVSRVKITSECESDGLGDKVRGAEFLKQFKGLGSTDADSISVDLVSRATVSSNAVKNGVLAALKLGLYTDKIAENMGLEIISADEIEEDVNKDSASSDKKPSVSEKPDTGKADSNNLNGQGGGSNANTGGGDMGIDGSDVTTVFDTETREEDTTGADTAPVTTEAPATDKPDTAPVTTAVTTAPPVTDTEPQETTVPAESDTEPDTSSSDDSQLS